MKQNNLEISDTDLEIAGDDLGTEAAKTVEEDEMTDSGSESESSENEAIGDKAEATPIPRSSKSVPSGDEPSDTVITDRTVVIYIHHKQNHHNSCKSYQYCINEYSNIITKNSTKPVPETVARFEEKINDSESKLEVDDIPSETVIGASTTADPAEQSDIPSVAARATHVPGKVA